MNEDYCYNCGEEDLKAYEYVGNFAGTPHYRCKTCGEDFTGEGDYE